MFDYCDYTPARNIGKVRVELGRLALEVELEYDSTGYNERTATGIWAVNDADTGAEYTNIKPRHWNAIKSMAYDEWACGNDY